MGVHESTARWSHLNLTITSPGGQGGDLGRAVGQMSPCEQGEAGQDPAGLAPPNLLPIGQPTRGTKMGTPTHANHCPTPWKRERLQGWRLQALGRSGFIHQLIPRKAWRRAWRLGWAWGQLVSKLVPGAAPRLRMEGCPGLRASTEQLSPPSPGQRPHSSRSHRELPGNWTSSPERTPPKFLRFFLPRQLSIYL